MVVMVVHFGLAATSCGSRASNDGESFISWPAARLLRLAAQPGYGMFELQSHHRQVPRLGS